MSKWHDVLIVSSSSAYQIMRFTKSENRDSFMYLPFKITTYTNSSKNKQKKKKKKNRPTLKDNCNGVKHF